MNSNRAFGALDKSCHRLLRRRSRVSPNGISRGPSPLRTSHFEAGGRSRGGNKDHAGAQLAESASGRAPTGIRNRALIVMGWRAGLRVQELLDLFPKDLDADSGTVNVANGKGGRQRLVGLDPTAFSVVERWLDRRRDLGFNGRQRLFCTL